jgi:hypothetical protein
MEALVLETTLVLTPESSRRAFDLPFALERPAERLRIDFSYEPKRYADREDSLRLIAECLRGRGAKLEGRTAERYLPLVNLVTISLDCGTDYIGCAHRHDREQVHFIGAAASSPGFFPFAPRAGAYRVVVSAHCVLSPSCEVSLRVGARYSP